MHHPTHSMSFMGGLGHGAMGMPFMGLPQHVPLGQLGNAPPVEERKHVWIVLDGQGFDWDFPWIYCVGTNWVSTGKHVGLEKSGNTIKDRYCKQAYELCGAHPAFLFFSPPARWELLDFNKTSRTQQPTHTHTHTHTLTHSHTCTLLRARQLSGPCHR